MRKPYITSRIWLFALFSLAIGLALLLLIVARDTLNQTEQAARDKAVTLARVLGYAISGVVRQSPVSQHSLPLSVQDRPTSLQ